MAKVIYSPTIEIERQLVTVKSIKILNQAAEDSNNHTIMIGSTIRLPSQQARIMATNLKAGNNIRYAAAGEQICKIYADCIANKMSEKDTILKMEEKIIELSLKSQRVSLHCVTADQYAKLNVIDIVPNIPNPRDFVKALVKNSDVVKIITPFASTYNNSKVGIDTKEPAIHIEIKQ